MFKPNLNNYLQILSYISAKFTDTDIHHTDTNMSFNIYTKPINIIFRNMEISCGKTKIAQHSNQNLYFVFKIQIQVKKKP